MLLNLWIGKKGRRKFRKTRFPRCQHGQPPRLRHGKPADHAVRENGEKVGLPSFPQTGKERFGVRFRAGKHGELLRLFFCRFRRGHSVRVKPKPLRHSEHFKLCEQPHRRRTIRRGGHIMR